MAMACQIIFKFVDLARADDIKSEYWGELYEKVYRRCCVNYRLLYANKLYAATFWTAKPPIYM